MVDLYNPNLMKGREPVIVSVPTDAKAERLLRRGWSLVEGQEFTRVNDLPEDKQKHNPAVATPESNAGDLINAADRSFGEGDTSLDDIPDGDDDGDGESDGDDGEEPASTPAARTAAPVPAGSLPGLSGKSREALVAIAQAEGVSFPDTATKPDVKRAIEAHRAAK